MSEGKSATTDFVRRELVRIEGEDIVISITPGALKFGTENCPLIQDWCGTFATYRKVSVVDVTAWRDAIVKELRREQEDGTTPVHLALDRAVAKAFEDGAEGISEELVQL